MGTEEREERKERKKNRTKRKEVGRIEKKNVPFFKQITIFLGSLVVLKTTSTINVLK